MTRTRCPTRIFISIFILFLLSFAVLFGFILPGLSFATEVDPDKTVSTAEATADNTISLQFFRENEDGEKLSGVVVTVYDKEGKRLWRGKTDADGLTTWKNVIDGEYIVKETKAPLGYFRDRDEYVLTIEKGKISEEETSSIILGNLTVEIVETENDKDDENNKSDSSSSTSNSKDESNGSASDNDSDSKEDEDSSNSNKKPSSSGSSSSGTTSSGHNNSMNGGEAVNEATKNEGDVYVTLTNTAADDRDNLVPIQNAEFTIYDVSGKKIISGRTDKNGKLSFYLAPGKYTFEQTYTPSGFKKASGDLSFQVYESGQVIGTTTIVSQRGSDGPSSQNSSGSAESASEVNVELTITTVSTLNNNPVVGVEITIENSNKELVKKMVSDGEGKITLDALAAGSYEIYQSTAADGYYKSTQRLKITVDDNGKISGDSLTFKCTPKGTAVITFVDKSTGGAISGVNLTITNENGSTVYTGTTNSNGTVAFGVPDFGTYTIKETSVPSNYNLNNSSYTFTVKDGFEITGTTKIEKTPLSTAKSSSTGSSVTASANGSSPSSSSSGNTSTGGSSNSEGVPQTGVLDNTPLLIFVSVLLLVIGISSVVIEQHYPDLLNKILRRKGGTNHGDN